MCENAYLSIKNPKASRALKRALDPGRRMLASLAQLRFATSATFGLRSWGPPLTKSWIRTCTDKSRVPPEPSTHTLAHVFSISWVFRVAMVQGDQEIWMFIFPDRENTRNLPKYLKKFFTQGIKLQHGEKFEFFVAFKDKLIRIVVGYCFNLLTLNQILTWGQPNNGMKFLQQAVLHFALCVLIVVYLYG